MQADEYERGTSESPRNRVTPKTVRTRKGKITYAAPHVRKGGFPTLTVAFRHRHP